MRTIAFPAMPFSQSLLCRPYSLKRFIAYAGRTHRGNYALDRHRRLGGIGEFHLRAADRTAGWIGYGAQDGAGRGSLRMNRHAGQTDGK